MHRPARQGGGRGGVGSSVKNQVGNRGLRDMVWSVKLYIPGPGLYSVERPELLGLWIGLGL